MKRRNILTNLKLVIITKIHNTIYSGVLYNIHKCIHTYTQTSYGKHIQILAYNALKSKPFYYGKNVFSKRWGQLWEVFLYKKHTNKLAGYLCILYMLYLQSIILFIFQAIINFNDVLLLLFHSTKINIKKIKCVK